MPTRVRFCMSWPPCTHLASSGARWWKIKGSEALAEGLTLAAAGSLLMDRSGAPWVMENPIGRLSRYFRKPDLVVNPWEFAGWSNDPVANSYSKKTALWLGRGARPPTPNVVPGLAIDTQRIHHAPSCSPRRSVTPDGLAYGMWVANDPPPRRARK